METLHSTEQENFRGELKNLYNSVVAPKETPQPDKRQEYEKAVEEYKKKRSIVMEQVEKSKKLLYLLENDDRSLGRLKKVIGAAEEANSIIIILEKRRPGFNTDSGAVFLSHSKIEEGLFIDGFIKIETEEELSLDMIDTTVLNKDIIEKFHVSIEKCKSLGFEVDYFQSGILDEKTMKIEKKGLIDLNDKHLIILGWMAIPKEPIAPKAPEQELDGLVPALNKQTEQTNILDKKIETDPFSPYEYHPRSVAATEFQRSKSLDTVMGTFYGLNLPDNKLTVKEFLKLPKETQDKYVPGAQAWREIIEKVGE